MPLPVDLPVAAREQSAAGAEAFMKFFYAEVNRAWTRPATGLIPPLCLSTSKSCAALEGNAAELVKNRQRYDGDPGTILSVLLRPKCGDANGVIVSTDPLEESHFEAKLKWVGDGWRSSNLEGANPRDLAGADCSSRRAALPSPRTERAVRYPSGMRRTRRPGQRCGSPRRTRQACPLRHRRLVRLSRRVVGLSRGMSIGSRVRVSGLRGRWGIATAHGRCWPALWVVVRGR